MTAPHSLHTSRTHQADSLRDRQVVITGARGFIGSHLVADLAEVCATVRAVDRDAGWRPHLAAALERPNVSFESGHEWPFSAHDATWDDADSLIHFAYHEPLGASLEVARAEFERNVVGTIDLLASLPATVRTVVFASSSLVYGPGVGASHNEDGPVAPVNAYSAAKLSVEHVLGEWAQAAPGRRAVALRLGTVYGPGELVPRAIPNFIRRSLAGAACHVGVAGDRRDYVEVSDVTGSVAAALASESDGPYTVANVGTGVGTSTAELADLVARLTGSGVPPQISDGHRPPVDIICDPTHAEHSIGFRSQVDLAVGLQREIDWFAERPELWVYPS